MKSNYAVAIRVLCPRLARLLARGDWARRFYPFDLLAAAHVVEPRQFRCAWVQAWVGADPMLFVPFWKLMALLVGPAYPSAVRPARR